MTDATATDRPPGSSAPGVTRSQLGMFVFLASDLMLFAPFFAAYFLLRSNAATWPPEGVELDLARAIAATAVLVTSSFALGVADRALERGSRRSFQIWLLGTIGLGTIFLVNQVTEYATISFAADDHTYGSIYWLLTGLHTAHVTIGVLAMSALFARTLRAPTVEALATWSGGISAFWHLVDVVWVGVFMTIWVIR